MTAILPLVSFFLFLGTSFGLTPEQQLAVDSTAENDFMAFNRIPGVGLTIVENNGASVYAKGYGYQNWEEGVQTTNSTQFCIASISKVRFWVV